ncbi:MAG TPA: pyrimidine 5'-nucleotidase [Anaerolineales bacterium]|nr:pyrimidine 5'-nucleotidase [Anaerolineales bacterium]
MPITTLFCDLDDTLYPNTNGLWGAIRERMNAYLSARLGFSELEILQRRRGYFETYGTTLRGLQLHHQVDAEDFLAFVHDLPLENYLSPDPGVRSLLLSLPQNKWIFTNADADHARRVLARLNLSDCFAGIIDILALGYICKPMEQAYRLALELAGETEPENCVMLDDSPRNLAPAHHMGFTTILVGVNGPDPAACFSIPGLIQLPRILPELWSGGPSN